MMAVLLTAVLLLLAGHARTVFAQCSAPLLPGVGLAGNTIASQEVPTPGECASLCCAHTGCRAWTWANRSSLATQTSVCYLKDAAVPEPCGIGGCISWSRKPVPPMPPPPPSPHWLCPAHACDRGWQKDTDGCCTRLALGNGSRAVGMVAYPHGANLRAMVCGHVLAWVSRIPPVWQWFASYIGPVTPVMKLCVIQAWEDRPYPWGGDAVLSEDGKALHGFVAEYSNHCPMTYGTWYSSTHIRHIVAPADPSTGLPAGPFVAKDVAVQRAAGNPCLLKRAGPQQASSVHVMYTTNQHFAHPVRNCSGVDPADWHRAAVYNPGSPMGVNVAWAKSMQGPWTVRYNILKGVPLPYGLNHTSNPAAVLLRNGTVILAYKTWPSSSVCTKLIGSPRCKAIGIVSTHCGSVTGASGGWNGSYTHRPMGDGFVAVGADIEDPSLYQDPASGVLHMYAPPYCTVQPKMLSLRPATTSHTVQQ